MTVMRSRRAKPATVAEVNALAKSPGRHSIGESLILCVSPTGARSWVARVRDAEGKRRDMGLGPFADLTLAEAREKARALRKAGRDGQPILTRAERREKLRRENGDAVVVPTLKEMAKRFHANRKVKWKSGKHQDQWLATLELYAFKALGDLRVDRITEPMVAAAISTVWMEKPETGRRVKQRISAVLTWANDLDYRSEFSSAKLGRALGDQPNNRKHFAHMPFAAVPGFIAALRGSESIGRLALEFTILCAARSGETRGARWEEFDLAKKLWIIPAPRMKMKREHRVPLCDRAVAIIQRAKEIGSSTEIVFPGIRGKTMNDATLSMVLRDAGVPQEVATVHGFRASFRTWAAEKTPFPSEVCEMALAHVVHDKTQAAYNHSDLLEKRRELMTAWARYCEGGSNVVRMVAG